jgi:exonuclease I
MNVIDTQILARNEVRKLIAIEPKWKEGEPPSGVSKLQHLTESLCGEDYPADFINGHDCVEDVYATREVLLVINHSRQKLVDWAVEYLRRSRFRVVGPPM